MSKLLPARLEANFSIQRYVGGASTAALINSTLYLKAISGLEFDSSIALDADELQALHSLIYRVLNRAQDLHNQGQAPLELKD